MKIFNPSAHLKIPEALALAAVILSLVLAQPLLAQSARLRVEENIRAEPGGQIIGRLQAGIEVRTGRTEEDWVQATFTGWIWAQSLRIRSGGAFDYRVSAPDGENLRDGPQGEILGRMTQGALLQEVESRPGWVHVQRTAWIWSPSLEVTTTRPAEDPAPTSSAPNRRQPERPASSDDWLRNDEARATLLASPDGDTLGVVAPGVDIRVLAREGNWARVRLEGWVWAPDFERDDSQEGPFLTSVTPQMLMDDPESYRGQTVSWEVQFISVERAEQIRTDFYEGEPFILARYGGDSGMFVYVAFPPDRLGEIISLTPLERIVVVGRVRAGRAALTGSPILDLLEVRRPGSDQ